MEVNQSGFEAKATRVITDTRGAPEALIRAITANMEAGEHLTSSTDSASAMAPRSLRAICRDARTAPGGCCWAHDPAWPCSFSGTGPDGLHLSRFAAARQRELISEADMTAVIQGVGLFTEATIIRDGDR